MNKQARVVDLGRQKSRRVSKLARGTGPLVKRVAEAVSALQTEEAGGTELQPVIVVVERRRRWADDFKLLLK
jgi:hypothetical protein